MVAFENASSSSTSVTPEQFESTDVATSSPFDELYASSASNGLSLTGNSSVPDKFVLVYVFVPVIVIFIAGGIVLAISYRKKRSSVQRLRRQLVPLKQYEVTEELHQDVDCLQAKDIGDDSKGTLLASETTDPSAVGNEHTGT